MEAAPRLALLNFALKISPEPVHFSQTLKRYIRDVYEEDGESYHNEFHQLEGLRAKAAHPTPDSDGLAALYRYFCQLRALQSRFLMEKGHPAAVQFTWKDIYSTNASITNPDIKFELACILYNIAAAHSHLGAAEDRNTQDGLKSACTHFQKAAWALQQINEQYSQPAGTDVSPEVIKVKHQVCLAQAQECILEKSIIDSRKSTTIGAVALQVLHYYQNAETYLNSQYSTVSAYEIMGSKFGATLQHYIQFKIAYIGSITYLYHGMNSEEQQKMGERVAFFQLAVEKLDNARKLMKHIQPKELTQEAVTFTNDVVEGKRKAAKNENEFIYHEDVPEKELLTMLKPASLVKEIPINFSDPEISGPDLFARLVPIGAHKISSMYSEEKAVLLRRVISSAEEKDQKLMEFLSSLQLDMLDALDKEESIPDEVVERCAAMNADSSIVETLVESMNSLADIISDVEHALADVKQLIQEETEQEKQYQLTMGARPPSIVQTELSREANKYSEAHAKTSESNQVLHKAMTLHLANLKLLASPLEELMEKIPSVAKIQGLDNETLAEMKKVMGAVHEMQKQRAQLIQQLREDVNSDDITSQLLVRDGTKPEDMFKQRLEKYEPKVKIIDLNLAAQENIINRMTTVYASYGESRRLLADVIRRREAFINALITSFDTRMELLGKAQKGLEFYRKLSNNVNQLLTRLKSTCQVQAEERATLLAKQQSRAPVAARSSEPHIPSEPESTAPKLKDYLPYMKNRAGKNLAAVQPEKMTSEQIHPETMYPTSVRPAPLGSEAPTDPAPTYMDGYIGSIQNAQAMYPQQYNYPDQSYGAQSLPGYQQYSHIPQTNYDYPEKSYTPQSIDSNSSYGTNYTPSQFPSQSTNVPFYTPYYTGSQDNNTNVTNSQNPANSAEQTINQENVPQNPGSVYMPKPGYPNQQTYNMQQYPVTPKSPIENPGYPLQQQPSVQSDLGTNFSQMQISAPASSTYLGDTSYSQTQFSAYYLQSMAPNVATYSNAAQPTLTNMTSSTNQAEYSSLNYPYSAPNVASTPVYSEQDLSSVTDDASTFMPYQHGQNIEDPNYKASNVITPTIPAVTPTSFSDTSMIQPHTSLGMSSGAGTNTFPEDKIISSVALPNIPVIDQPIKSHVSGQALSTTNLMQQVYNQSIPGSSVDPNISYGQGSIDPSQQQIPYNPYPQEQSQIPQHPGYIFNPVSGNYEYSYDQQSYDITSQSAPYVKENVYTPTNVYSTVPSVNTESAGVSTYDTNYSNQSYGYQSNVATDIAPAPVERKEQSNYGPVATQTTNAGSANVAETKYNPVSYPTQDTPDNAIKTEIKTEQFPEQTSMDLLSGLDFSVDRKPLTPEIKVPPVSASVIFKPAAQKIENVVKIEQKSEEIIERPAKMDLFSDPNLLNKFTQEVKNLQKLVDGFMNKMQSGITVLDNKWKVLHDTQAKDNAGRSKSAAMAYYSSNVVSEVVPFDDSRLTLKANPEVFINASYYKQLAPWCIPLVISNIPAERERLAFWTAALERKVACVVCLLSEMEMQGQCYWPTAIGQSLPFDGEVRVTLDEVSTTVHWTERRMTVKRRNVAHSLTHYHINVFPKKVVSGPLVMLADKVLSLTYTNRLSNQLQTAWIHCDTGAGRSCLVSLLLMLMCQVRAGQSNLCEMLDSACLNLYKGRTNVLKDTKFLADAYRSALFFAQGVICSGTTNFNGETISVASGTVPAPSPSLAAPKEKTAKFSKESFEEMKQTAGLKTGDMKDPLSFLDPLWSLKKK